MSLIPDHKYGEWGAIQIDYRGKDGFLILLGADDAGRGGQVVGRATNYQDADRIARMLARAIEAA